MGVGEITKRSHILFSSFIRKISMESSIIKRIKNTRIETNLETSSSESFRNHRGRDSGTSSEQRHEHEIDGCFEEDLDLTFIYVS